MLYPDDPDFKIKVSIWMALRQVTTSEIIARNFFHRMEDFKPVTLDQWKAASVVLLTTCGVFVPEWYNLIDAAYNMFDKHDVKGAFRKHLSVIGS